jgi:hypothetical protein
MEPAKFFGFNVDTWYALIWTGLGLVAMTMVALQKKRKRAELGDGDETTPHAEEQQDAGGDQHPPR